MELGKVQKLKVASKKDGIIFLEDEEKNRVRLSKSEGEKLKVGEEVEAFVYNIHDEFEATLKKPYAEVGDLRKLKVVDKAKVGYFVDNGIGKDIFLPFKESYGRLTVGNEYLLYLYHDKSDRLALTMNIKNKLKTNENYKINDIVKGTIYSIGDKGAFVAIENEYDGMIPKEELKGIYKIGDEVEARVQRILQTGFITLTLRQKAYKQIDADSDLILELLEENGGVLEIGDKSDKELIKDLTGLSKKAYKRAVGNLYKNRIINIYDTKIELKHGRK
ncbi:MULTISPECIES: S1 RNA-binding domain-containing protein [Peptoniphilus]|uniref:CvfB family protein n=1 Tax=Peptoniphilus TaxID=162289 RepID=UPI0025910A4C|nr:MULTISPECIES: S1-like domain-containing RNA-binding protein [Peptoniphilus]MBS6611272.1 S1 RNA-binding domain-containing protein [Peptoniphilus harei]MDU2116101.1 S1-like domain-containing RNA-binding protein [Peptoniphilus lacydonensis]MDU3751433.1 S1-like domain-containing RNA-binding protein [Peptoniphilus rhinitidis]MDU5378007.1 S1-like domain-containing RNA-binding protein [Peptoniphilus lacydonensis]MDU5437143.1 S1-like domain-containing RNA-binding protein [Peptoniphilus lacydonensis